MGFRYRKSIKLGGGFRVNLSKSGVGYSWGVKGFRVSKTASGGTRTTVSIPGTGVSHVQESNTRKNSSSKQQASARTSSAENNHYDTQDIVNHVASDMVSEGLEEMLSSARLALRIRKISVIGLLISVLLGTANPAFSLVALAFAVILIYVYIKGTIDLEYSIDDDQQTAVDKRMDPMIRITECDKVWRIMQTSKVSNRKYEAGASSTVSRTACSAKTKPPFPFKANVKTAAFKAKKETLLFLPDKLFIIQGSKIGALNYSDVKCSAHTTRFIESESVPKDAKVVGQTWKYVNQSGGPDKRFKDNKQLPICLYGELELTSESGLNTVIMFSDPDLK